MFNKNNKHLLFLHLKILEILQHVVTYMLLNLKNILRYLKNTSVQELVCWLGVKPPLCSGLCFCFFLFFSFFRFFRSFSSSCRFCFLCFFSWVSCPTSATGVSWLGRPPSLCLCFLCLFLCFLIGVVLVYRYCSGS